MPLDSSAQTGAADLLALDRSSVRTRDENGYLHIEVSNISKACVNPYFGKEIPEYERLGLNPDQVYQLLRDPQEMAAAVGTFDGMPLMMVHKPQSARDFKREIVVGSLGRDTEFKDPYLRNSMVVWDAQAIAGIETRDQQELSCGYRYDADMTPGEYKGARYDGVMRNLRGNHITLVPDGRAGSDVVVGDQNISLIIKELPTMAKAPLSPTAARVKVALAVHLAPKLAQDTKLDFGTILAGITAKNWTAMRPEVISRLGAATKGKLAQDATLDDVTLLLDALDKNDMLNPDDDTTPTAAMAGDDDLPEDVRGIVDGLKDKLSPEDHAKLCEALKGAKPLVVGDDTPAVVMEGDDKVSKPAMDAAIKAATAKATKDAETTTMARLNAVRDAENIARPYVGSLAIAQDSAEGVFRFALDALKVGHEGITEVAGLKALLLAHPKPGERHGPAPRLAHDAASAGAYAARFPDANRLSTH